MENIMQIENYIEINCESIRRNSGEIDNIVIKLMRRLMRKIMDIIAGAGNWISARSIAKT
jgi:hypothetical protein